MGDAFTKSSSIYTFSLHSIHDIRIIHFSHNASLDVHSQIFCLLHSILKRNR